jgi:hypothetical protein
MTTTAGIIGARELADLARAIVAAFRRAPHEDHRAAISSFEREMHKVIGGLDERFEPESPAEAR